MPRLRVPERYEIIVYPQLQVIRPSLDLNPAVALDFLRQTDALGFGFVRGVPP